MSPSAPALTPEQVAQRLTDALDEPYDYIGRFAGGETGAFEVRGPADERLVLKWSTSPSSFASRARAVDLTDLLRTAAGWPVPHQRVVDLALDGARLGGGDPESERRCQVILQEHLPGEPITTLTRSLTDELVTLVGQARGLAPPAEPVSLRDTMVKTLTAGGDGYCLHEPMRVYDARTKDLIERIEAIGAAVRDAPAPPATDLIHFDLHAGNVLVQDATITGIIDTEYASVGDGGFDLVALAVCACDHHPEPGVEDLVWDVVEREVAEPWRTAFVAHMLLRNVDWSIRNHGADDVEQWLAEADRLLPP